MKTYQALIPWAMLLLVSSAWGQTPEAPKRTTHTVEPGRLLIKIELDNVVIESTKTSEVLLKPESWSYYKVKTTVKAGATVKKGDTLIQLETKEIDEAIKQLEQELEIDRKELELATQELEFERQSLPLNLENVAIAEQLADEAYKDYLELLRPLDVKSLEYFKRSSEQSLEYAMEELEQLEKMYKADDLTEETEEIILKRAQNDVEDARFMAEHSKVFNLLNEKDLPNQDRLMKESLRLSKQQYSQSRLSLPLQLRKAEVTHYKAEVALRTATENLDKLKKDRAAMTLTAQQDGVLYPGQVERGMWMPPTSKVAEGEPFMAGMTVMTIVDPASVQIRGSIGEGSLAQVEVGSMGTFIPTAFPDAKIPAKLEELGQIPMLGNSFDVKLSITIPENYKRIMPGMTGKVSLKVYDKADALTIPAVGLFQDDSEEPAYHVFVSISDTVHEKRTVKIGRRTSDKIEITEGLKAGEKILLEDPTKKPAAG